jgi:hypothetical protein
MDIIMNNFFDGLKRIGSLPEVVFFNIVAVFLLAGYVIFYQFAPLTDPFNSLVLNSITSIAALACAGISTVIFLHYHPQDHPRRIWKNIAIGTWLWFFAEAAWQVYAFIFEEVPIPSVADLGWVLGFVFFSIALYHQYADIIPVDKDVIRTYVIGLWLVMLLTPLILLTVFDAFSIPAYIDFYYPFADIAVGVAGLVLVLIFKGGALMRPWLGLMVFGASDLLYAWAETTQMYAWSVENGNILTLVIDSTYLAAYLILAIGFLGHWILLTRGLRRR